MNKIITLDYSAFANVNNDIFNELTTTTKYNNIKIQKAIYDELHLIENITTLNTSDKKIWNYDTILLCLFDGNLEGGNIGLGQSIPIAQLKIKRKKAEDLIFEEIKSFNYNPDIQNYEFKDKYVESLQDYTYAIQTVGGDPSNPVLGSNNISEIFCEFENTWLLDKDKQFKLIFNLKVGDYETVIPTEIMETFGNQYPILSTNGNIKYRKGNLQCMLVSDTTCESGQIDKKAEKLYRKAIYNFLTDRKPKLFKDGSGEMMLIRFIDSPILTPNNNLNQLIYNVSINFVEIGNANINTLTKNGLLEI